MDIRLSARYNKYMSDRPSEPSNRREFLTGKALRDRIEAAGDQLADHLVGEKDDQPAAGGTVRLSTNAMACEFSVIMNPGPAKNVMLASDALDMLHPLEQQMTVYRDDSALSQINRTAATEPIEIETNLFRLLLQSDSLSQATSGAFDPTSGPLVRLWRSCRNAGRIPRQSEIDPLLQQTGMEHLSFDLDKQTVKFGHPAVELNLGGIGKGYALDQVAQFLQESLLQDFLIHGGHSSLLAKGDHNEQGGWPVSIGNPLFTKKKLATIILQDAGLSTSGSNVQFFRKEGRRFGHILDPRTGWPAEELLSVTVIAPTAAEADALSTAFFVLGLEKTLEYCHNRTGIGIVLVPPPQRGRLLEPVVHGIPDKFIFFEQEDVQVQRL